MKVYLRMGDDYLDEATPHGTKADAIATYLEVARELEGYGQAIEASLHYAQSMAEVVEYPDAVLSLGPRGGLVVQNT